MFLVLIHGAPVAPVLASAQNTQTKMGKHRGIPIVPLSLLADIDWYEGRGRDGNSKPRLRRYSCVPGSTMKFKYRKSLSRSLCTIVRIPTLSRSSQNMSYGTRVLQPPGVHWTGQPLYTLLKRAEEEGLTSLHVSSLGSSWIPKDIYTHGAYLASDDVDFGLRAGGAYLKRQRMMGRRWRREWATSVWLHLDRSLRA